MQIDERRREKCGDRAFRRLMVFLIDAELLFFGFSGQIGTLGMGPVVTADTESVQNGLYFQFEIKTAWWAAPRFDRVGRRHGGEGRIGRRRRVLPLVAAGTRKHFARHGGEPTAHQLHRSAAVVQRLQRDGRVGRHGKQRRTIRLDRNRAQDVPRLPRPVHSGSGQVAESSFQRVPIQVVVRKDAQLLGRTARDAAKSRSFVDV